MSMPQPWPAHPGSPSDSDQGSLSPRTALLSPPPFEDDLPRRIPRGPGVKFRRERERAHSTATPRDLLEMLVSEEYESKQTRKILYTAFDRLDHETKRADAAEARIHETIQRVRGISEARAVAQQQAARAQEELKMYKLQLDNAQQEILRAQEVLKALEAQRYEAEVAAISARSKARKLEEERMIEFAREQGRRLGFEEGVRRGRTMGYREAYDAEIEDRHDDVREVATAVVDRLLEGRDEPEEIEVLEEPTPIPPPSIPRTPPQVHRLETPINSSLENQRYSSRSRRDSFDSASRSTLRQAPDPLILPNPHEVEPRTIPNGMPPVPIITSQSSRPQSASQPWSGPPTEPSYSRPISIQNSPPNARRSEVHIPPDNYIPTVDSNYNITLPPPHELQRNIPSPTPSQQTLGRGSERGRNGDYIYGNYPPPRRGSPDESLASAQQSAASTISQLDIVGLPPGVKHRDRPQGLSVIHEDASMRSEHMSDYSRTAGSTSRGHHIPETRSNETLRRDKKAKQRLADELRYSDPSEAEEWRQRSHGSHSQQRHDGPPRHRPSHITVPTPLSPPRVLQQSGSRVRRTTSERQGRSETRSEHRDKPRPLSSDSSVPEINVEPPSGPSSDAPSRGRGNPPVNGLLSPDHAHHPLPVPAPSGTGGRVSPVIPKYSATSQDLAGHIYAIPSDGQAPPGFIPSPTGNAPVIPQSTGGAVPSQPYAPHRTSSDRESGRSRSPISFYAASPVPAGVTYPVPPVSRSAAYNANPYPPTAGSNPSITSEGRRRRDSLSATAGMTPAFKAKPMQSTGSADGSSRVSRRPSNASLTSQQSRPYSRYDPNVYNDPAYLASSDSLVDSVNTANGGGGGPVRPVRVQGSSPAYMYASLRSE